MDHFSERLKKLRTVSGFSMQDLAEKANVSKSMISKIERNEVQPTLDVAHRLSKALGKTLSEMLHAVQATQVVFLPRAEQAVWEDAQHIKRRNISPVFEGLKIEWLHVELPPGISIIKSLTNTASGEKKYILAIKGILEVRINQKTYRLKKGDSIYFEADSPHEFTNPGKEPVEFYIIIKHA